MSPIERRALAVLLLLLAAAEGRALDAPSAEDAFAAGYAAGWLDQEHGLTESFVTVERGTATIGSAAVPAHQRAGAAQALLRRLPALAEVRFADERSGFRRPPSGAGTPLRLEVSSTAVSARGRAGGLSAFPRRLLFDPLVADPRWPRFSGSVQNFSRASGIHSKRLWSGTFGESFPLAGWRTDLGHWQLGIQAGVFTTWDLGTISEDFVNADFLVGIPLTWRSGRLSAMARLFHISTHLGDELILRHPTLARMNLAFEALDARAAYDLPAGFRVYGGGGYRIRRDPNWLKPAFAQAGLEYDHAAAWFGLLRPVAAVDLKKHQENGWGRTDVSSRAGFQLGHRSQPSRRLLLLGEHYAGRDPNGQFFLNSVSYHGAGLHLHF